ncbi:MAG TPA: prepilin-type N-terminal cleavage/methylation domain-containing protein [Alphaproteobacteria bacterium]|nr:prepilin-type N-terminal cleavage/methylation domain-containing protein [Alphaproteobacteria bacterium]
MKKNAGVSLVELLVVVGIMMMLCALATPTILIAINNMKLRSSAASLAGLVQETRMLAVRDNKFYTMRPTSIGSANFYYIDLDENSTYRSGEELIQIAGVVKVVSSSTVPVKLTATNYVLEDAAPVSFNPRGLPCLATGTNPSTCPTMDAAGNQVGFVYYLYIQPYLSGSSSYKAVSVTPAGRVRIWSYSGGTWQ